MKSKIKIMVFSDTHKNISNAIDVIINEKPDYVFHLGDHSEDGEELERLFDRIKFVYVSGNCDWSCMSRAPVERFFEIDGVKIFMCHGHTYRVKSGTDVYLAEARRRGADVALFGHTHKPLYEHGGDVALLNPGSVSTYGWLEISGGAFSGGIKRYGE